ncbi:MAG: tryptophan synthase subunit alpha [Planctomycetota bacterium]
MGRIDEIFQELRSEQRGGLIPYICAGDPPGASIGDVLRALDEGGGSIVEVGIPFSDPIADGPVIAAAMHRALEAGWTPERVFEEIGACRDGIDAGLVAMVSVSIVQRMGGPESFVKRASEAGFDGFIFPDATLETSEPFMAPVREAGLSGSLLVSPTTPPERAALIASSSAGFVYLLARSGITGEREDAPDIAEAVTRIRETTDTPIACGFGISRPEHVHAVVEHADAAIVGSALVRRLMDSDNPVTEARSFAQELSSGLGSN